MHCEKGLNIEKKAFLTKHISVIIENKTLVKYKDPGCPTISLNIEEKHIEKALLDLGVRVNISILGL